MSDATPDLWPEDLFSKHVRTPKRVLKEQAAHMNRRGGFINAQVVHKDSEHLERLEHEFWLNCNILERRILLFHLFHSKQQVYPCEIYCVIWSSEDPRDSGEVIASSEDELMERLKEIFGSSYVREIVQSMQAEASDKIDESV